MNEDNGYHDSEYHKIANAKAVEALKIKKPRPVFDDDKTKRRGIT